MTDSIPVSESKFRSSSVPRRSAVATITTAERRGTLVFLCDKALVRLSQIEFIDAIQLV
jgi:hypothetical protein